MLGWLFKKKATTTPAAPPPAAAAKAATPLAAPHAPSVDWSVRLAQAGDDDARLALLRDTTAPLPTRQAAVDALVSEAALAVAERELRQRDRRLHQAAKRRLQAAVAQRQTRAQAERLLDAARGLAGTADTAVNRIVELDRAWQALDATALEPAQRDSFAALTAQLAALVRQHADTELQRKRWQADATLAARQLQAASTDAAAGAGDRATLAAAQAAAAAVADRAPPDAAAAAATQTAWAALLQARATAQALDLRLAVLERLLQAPVAAPAPQPDTTDAAGAANDDGAAEPAAAAPVAAAGDAGADDPARDWALLPTLPDAQLAALLDARHARWQRARAQAVDQARQAQLAQRRSQSRERQRAHADSDAASVHDALQQVEAALDGGQLATAQRVLDALDHGTRSAELSDALHVRIAAAQARLSQLRGWQHWAGGRARDELVLQAEALAAATVGGDADAPADKPADAHADAPADAPAGAHAGAPANDAAEAAAAAPSDAGATEPAASPAAAAAALAARSSSDAAAATDDADGTTAASADTDRDDAAANPIPAAASATSGAGMALAADAPAAPARSARGTSAGAMHAAVARLSIRQRADVIATLRARWKEIDRAGGGAGSRALWQRFDAALQAAHAPVAAHAASLRATRADNLAARLQLLAALEAVPGLPAHGAAEASSSTTTSSPSPSAAAAAAPPGTPDAAADAAAVAARPPAGIDLDPASDAPPQAQVPHAGTAAPGLAPAAASPQQLASALDRFQTEWRKLGPLEHTVPRSAAAALMARMEAATRRVDAPLQAARQHGRAAREQLVAQARSLADGARQDGRDLVHEARALQAAWQQQAKALPLGRRDEQALWLAFKAQVDAAFAARDAVFQARDAELEAHADARLALIARLHIDPADDAAAQRRLLADVEAAWQRCGPAPRARAAALDAAYRSARAALQGWLDDAAQRQWQTTCDALDAKLAMCLAREQDSPAAGAEPADRTPQAQAWQALAALPAPLEDALRRRAGLAPAATLARPASPADIDALLLAIEAAWQLPTPPAFEAARRERKLLAMKATLEGRRGSAPEPAPAAALALVLGQGGLDAAQQARLAAVLDGWRRLGPAAAAR